jgi:hypothetical protein
MTKTPAGGHPVTQEHAADLDERLDAWISEGWCPPGWLLGPGSTPTPIGPKQSEKVIEVNPISPKQFDDLMPIKPSDYTDCSVSWTDVPLGHRHPCFDDETGEWMHPHDGKGWATAISSN